MRPVKRLFVICCVALFGAFSFAGVQAAVIVVSPGIGTLAVAVQSAASGDTLILEEGAYPDNITLDKSLTIRPTTRSTQAILSGIITIDGPGIEVTLQGLEFKQNLLVCQQDWQRGLGA